MFIFVLFVAKVDLLGDQVEALQDLLRRIYFVLDQNLPVLSHNVQVSLQKKFNIKTITKLDQFTV